VQEQVVPFIYTVYVHTVNEIACCMQKLSLLLFGYYNHVYNLLQLVPMLLVLKVLFEASNVPLYSWLTVAPHCCTHFCLVGVSVIDVEHNFIIQDPAS